MLLCYLHLYSKKIFQSFVTNTKLNHIQCTQFLDVIHIVTHICDSQKSYFMINVHSGEIEPETEGMLTSYGIDSGEFPEEALEVNTNGQTDSMK